MNATIKDVAKLAGVSPSTVSRVVQNNPRISEDTSRRVKDAMKTLNYHPNIMARSLVSQSTGTIGMIFGGPTEVAFSNVFFNDAMRGVIDYTSKHGYDTIVASANSYADLHKQVVNLVRGRKVDGLIVLNTRVHDATLEFLTGQNFPFVIIGNSKNPEHHTVDNNNFQAAFDLTQHLLNAGHTTIGFITSTKTQVYANERYKGYLDAITAAGLTHRPELVFENHKLTETNYHEIALAMSLEDHPTAFIAINDDIAFGIIQKLRELNLSVPQDVSVVGFNNAMISQVSNPTITTVDIGTYQLGFTSVFTLLRMLRGETSIENRVIIPHRIIFRESSGSI